MLFWVRGSCEQLSSVFTDLPSQSERSNTGISGILVRGAQGCALRPGWALCFPTGLRADVPWMQVCRASQGLPQAPLGPSWALLGTSSLTSQPPRPGPASAAGSRGLWTLPAAGSWQWTKRLSLPPLRRQLRGRQCREHLAGGSRADGASGAVGSLRK